MSTKTIKRKRKCKVRPLKVHDYILVGTDHPYSLGAPVCLLVEEGMFEWPSVPTDVLDKYLESVRPGLSDSDAACVWDGDARAHVLVFKPSSRGYHGDFVRQLELIVHETSHLVDNLLRFIGESNQQGEIRAYLHDWVASKCFAVLRSRNMETRTK